MTNRGRPLLLIELNEVTNLVLDRRIATDPQSALGAFLMAATRADTILPHKGLLEPWTVWPSVHRGIPNWEHRIEALGQPTVALDKKAPPIWEIAAGAGVRIGVFGSLHARVAPSRNTAFFVPDYFSGQPASPPWLDAFHAFNSAMTQRSRHNVSRSLEWSQVRGLLGCGITRGTFLRAGRQLAEELLRPSRRIHRRALQTRVMADVFLNAVEREVPQFASIFINGVATALHRYWAAAWPDDFESLPLSTDFLERYRSAIDVAFLQVDPLFARAREWADRARGLVMVASGFGQQPVPTFHTFRFVTITDPIKFARVMGVADGALRVHASMTPYFSFEIRDGNARRFEDALRSIRIGRHRMMYDNIAGWPMSAKQVEPGFFSVYLQFDDYRGEQVLHLGEKKVAFADAGLGLSLHEDGIQYSAYHTNLGSLAVYDPLTRVSLPPEVSALDIAPSILGALGVPVPDYMSGTGYLLSD